MKSVVLFGDSMFGRFSRDYILRLEESVKDITVYNCATGGFNTRDGLKRIDFISKLKADYVCLSFGANDSNPFKGQPVPLEEFEKNFISIIKSFSGSKIILFPCPPVYDPNDPAETKNFNEILAQYNSVIKDIATKTNSEFINVITIYGELLRKGENYHIEDGLHLNDLGYQKLIEELIKFIK